MEKLIPVKELIGDDGKIQQTWTGAGGYALTFLDERDNVICGDCAPSVHDYLWKHDIKGAFIHWEGAPLYCNECDRDIESEYGEPEEDDDEPEDIGRIQSEMARHARENIRKEAPWILGDIDD